MNACKREPSSVHHQAHRRGAGSPHFCDTPPAITLDDLEGVARIASVQKKWWFRSRVRNLRNDFAKWIRESLTLGGSSLHKYATSDARPWAARAEAAAQLASGSPFPDAWAEFSR